VQVTNDKTGIRHYTVVRYEHGSYAARVYRVNRSGERTCVSYSIHPTRHKARHYADDMVKALSGNHAYSNQ